MLTEKQKTTGWNFPTYKTSVGVPAGQACAVEIAIDVLVRPIFPGCKTFKFKLYNEINLT